VKLRNPRAIFKLKLTLAAQKLFNLGIVINSDQLVNAQK